MKEGMKEVALRMLAAGKYALEEIVNISGLSLVAEAKSVNSCVKKIPSV